MFGASQSAPEVLGGGLRLKTGEAIILAQAASAELFSAIRPAWIPGLQRLAERSSW